MFLLFIRILLLVGLIRWLKWCIRVDLLEFDRFMIMKILLVLMDSDRLLMLIM